MSAVSAMADLMTVSIRELPVVGRWEAWSRARRDSIHLTPC